MVRRVHLVLLLLPAAGLLAACRAAPTPGGTSAKLDPSNVVATVDHPYFPLAPGSRWIYTAQTEDGTEDIAVEVQPETRDVMGIQATVVRDTVSKGGELVEDTYDWYAQDKDGNVWYLGEDVKNYSGGQLVDTEGSWEAGVDGAEAGVIMFAEPRPGGDYRQEYLAGKAEDMAKVVARDGTADVPFGTFSDLVVTEEWTPLEPGVRARKYYAAGVGNVLEESIAGETERVQLVSFTAR
jgi:hypothetical protein